MKPDADSIPQAFRVGTAVRSMLRAGRAMQSAMARDLHMGETDLAAMDELAASPEPMGPVELGRRLGIRSASATVLVDRLESVGHLERQPHVSDRRRIVLQATDTAIAEVRETLMPMMMTMGEIAGRLDPHDAEVVLNFMEEMTAAMYDFAAETGTESKVEGTA